MVNNLAKFREPESMEKRILEEGIADYHEEREAQDEAKMYQEIDMIIDSFYEDGYVVDNPEKGLILSQYPKEVRNAIFTRWFERDPDGVLFVIEYFRTLPTYFQKDIGRYLASGKANPLICDKILQVFKKITDYNLQRLLLDNASFLKLAEYKDKLPDISDEQILQQLNHGSWYDWASLIPYIDKFPSVDKRQAIDGVLKQSVNSRPWVLFEYKEKLGISEQELLDLFYQNRKIYELCKVLEYIDPKYHQKIAEEAIEERDPLAVIQNAKKFQQVDVVSILTAISKLTSDKLKGGLEVLNKNGLEVLFSNFYFLPDSWISQIPKEIVDEAIKYSPTNIAYKINILGEKVDRNALIESLFKKKKFETLIDIAEELGLERNVDLAMRIINAGGALSVIRNLDKFPRLPRIVYKLLFKEEKQEVIPKILSFNGITKEDVFEAIKGVRHYFNLNFIYDLIHKPTLVKGFTLDQEFANVLIESNATDILLKYLEKFENINFVAIANTLIEAGQIYELILYLDKFKGLNHEWLANEAIERGMIEILIDYYHNFQGLDDTKIVQKILKRKKDCAYKIAEKIESFPGLVQDRLLGEKIWRECLLYNWEAEVMAKLNEFYSPPLDQTFTLAYDLLGKYLTQDTYRIIKSIKEGSITRREMESLGITKIGDVGINQLRQILNRFKSEILNPDFDASILEDSEFYRQYYKSYIRFTVSEWGRHDEESFEQIVKTYSRLKKEGSLRDIPEEFVPSGEVRIRKVDSQKQETFHYSEHFLSRFRTLQKSLAGALELFEQKKPFSYLVERAETKRTKLLQAFRDKLVQLQHPKAVENLQKRINMLEKLDLRSIKNFQSNFEVLFQFNEFHEELRQLVFYYALHKNNDYLEYAQEMVSREKPRFNDVGWMINFIEHIVNEETWKKYFTNKRAAKSFRKLVNVNALNEEFSRAQKQATLGTTSMEFIPTRGLLMEFSGHIADACWASKYDSIAKEFPNFSAVIFVQNRGTKYERLVGACMLIETVALNGRELLVIRGLNPIENVINSLNIEDFYQKFTDYVKRLAERTGRQAAIVIDDHAGGSSTNRPALFNFLKEKKKSLQRVKLASKKDTTFNGYNIVDCTYII